MKIQCDVCCKEEATVFCSADEAALCEACDHRVHHANKLASKHFRFSLLRPSSKDSPRCDICQERRALLFCHEDRALLCRECDIPIHNANIHTQKHNRFLLTGIKLSTSSSSSSNQTSSSSCSISTAGSISKTEIKSSAPDETFMPNSIHHAKTSSESTSHLCSVDSHYITQDGSVSTSSITEYLMETLPGWHVEDFLDPSCSPNAFCKTHDRMSPFTDEELQSNLDYSTVKDLPIWVPQASSTAIRNWVVHQWS